MSAAVLALPPGRAPLVHMNCPSHACAAVLLIGPAFRDAKTKESRAIPCRPGNGAGNRRKARIGRIPPDEPVGHHGDSVSLAPIFTDEDGAGLEASIELGFFTAGEAIEQFDC